jgi:hypothetical protein
MDTQTLINAIGDIHFPNEKAILKVRASVWYKSLSIKEKSQTEEDVRRLLDQTQKALLGVHEVYSTPFDRITILSMFHEPVNLIWKEDKTVLNGKRVKRHYFSLDNVDYKPKTIADFVSLIDSLERHKLTPKFSGDKSSAALLWNKSRNNTQ